MKYFYSVFINTISPLRYQSEIYSLRQEITIHCFLQGQRLNTSPVPFHTSRNTVTEKQKKERKENCSYCPFQIWPV